MVRTEAAVGVVEEAGGPGAGGGGVHLDERRIYIIKAFVRKSLDFVLC